MLKRLKKSVDTYLKKKREHIEFSDVEPVLDYQEDCAVMVNGDIAFIFRTECQEEERLSKADYQDAIDNLQNMLNAMDVASQFQKLDIYYDRLQENNERYNNHQNRFIKKIASHFEGRPVQFHQSYVVIVFGRQMTKKTPSGTKFSNLGKSHTAFSDIDKRLYDARRKITNIQSYLSEVFLEIEPLKEQQIKSFYYQYYNQDFTKIPTSPVKQHANEFSCYSIGEKKVNIVTMGDRPDEFHKSIKDESGIYRSFIHPLAAGLKCNHIVSQVIRIKDTERELKSLDAERKRIETSEQADAITAQEIYEFTEKVRLDNEKLVDFSLAIIISESNDYLRESAVSEAEEKIRSLAAAVPFTETSEDIGNLFWAHVPGNTADNFRWINPLLASQALCCFNYATSFRGDGVGDYLCNRNRELVQLNLASDDDLNNRHAIILGPSGSGKSATTAVLIGQRHARREKQIIIDSGGTYKNLVTLFKGDYKEYDPENPMRSNPFIIPSGHGFKYYLSEEKNIFLLDFIVTAWKGEEEKAKEIELATLRRWLNLYYEYVNEQDAHIPTLTKYLTFIKDYLEENIDDEEVIKDNKFLDVSAFMRIMEQYTKGIYAIAINSEDVDTITGDNDLICYDLKRIKENGKLYPLVTKQLLELTRDFTARFEHIVKWLYLEEAWNSLEDSIGEMVAMLFRTWRKHNGAVYTITQGIKEIQDSKIGQSMLDNSDVRIILNHKGKKESEIESLVRAIGLTDLETDKLLGLRKANDYRDALIKRMDRTDVVTIEMPSYIYAPVTSKEKERNLLRKMYEYYGNMEYAVQHYVELKEELQNAG